MVAREQLKIAHNVIQIFFYKKIIVKNVMNHVIIVVDHWIINVRVVKMENT